MAPHHSSPQPPVTSRSLARALLGPAVAALLGFLLIYNSFGTTTDAKPSAGPVASAPASRPPVDPAAPDAAAESRATPVVEPLSLTRSEPERIRIPRIAVDAPFMGLSVGASGMLDAPPPDDRNLVGWWQEGVTPGEVGASIVAGHVDTRTGPAVFLLLPTLKAGDTVDIARADGSVATFVVDSVENFSKASFPNERVYADTPDAQLRLITCGGEYDRKAKDYKENVVVFAHLDSVKQP
ncbi:class F sortase [Streptomyces sp. t39]|uniref:class F sortase n=1 Tax=Streptomyces sp. t39 TaxID=1828156 RepID=UPI0011CE9A73|nr:class F sortase [Streptomyces sp. t39]TXS51627.1 class F sortase [Streptomyces sp. t39]